MEFNKISPEQIELLLTPDMFDTDDGKAGNGALVQIVYTLGKERMKEAEAAVNEAVAAGFPPNQYTGNLVKIAKSAVGDTILTITNVKERGGKFRSFNLNKGCVLIFDILGSVK